MTHEEMLKQAENAMKAIENFKSEFPAAKLEKLDSLDIEKINSMQADIDAGLKSSQEIQMQQKAEAKALADKVEALEAALARPATNEQKKDELEAEKKQFAESFNTFLKKGAPYAKEADFADYIAQNDLEFKALSVNSNVDGGFLVMPEFGGVVNTRVFETSPVRAYANVMTIGTDAIELVLDNDEAAAGWVAETGGRPETNTAQLDKKVIATHEMYANPRVTQKLLDDAVVSVDQWLAGKVADKFSRLEATAFVAGDGVGKPMGILTNLTTGTGFDAENIQQVVSGTQGSLTYNGFVNLQSALKELYQAGAIFMMKRATFGSAMKIVDGDSRPIFNLMFEKNTGVASTILGKPVVFADDVPAVANDSNSVIYGDFAAGYTIVDRIGIRVLRDPYSAKPYIQFYTTKRVGGDVVNTEALKVLALSN